MKKGKRRKDLRADGAILEMVKWLQIRTNGQEVEGDIHRMPIKGTTWDRKFLVNFSNKEDSCHYHHHHGHQFFVSTKTLKFRKNEWLDQVTQEVQGKPRIGYRLRSKAKTHFKSSAQHAASFTDEVLG